MKGKGHYINGRWIEGKGPRFDSINPASNALVWQGHHADNEEISFAYEAAFMAKKNWSYTSFEERADFVFRFGQQIEKNQDRLALCISEENGKPLWEARSEVKTVLDKILLSIQAYKERTWPKETQMGETNACLRFKPQGVVAILGPFNFPAHLSNGHLVPALLAGNTILYKPSEQTPKVAELYIQAWHESGLPAGVINCLQGDASTAKHLLSQNVQAVYFTGSYATGLKINQQFCKKPEVLLALEMGGNNPLILDEVHNIKAALYQTLLSTFISAGQRCTCARRLMIPQSSKGDEFLNQFIKLSQSIQISAFDKQPEPFMGPIINKHQAEQVLKTQDQLIQLGGQPLLLMRSLIEGGAFLSPGIIDMTGIKAEDEEIFAPLVQVYRYKTFDEAIHLANQTRYGLVAGLLSDNKQHYQHFYQSIFAGLINWNKPTTGASSSLPFGGVGFSGNHRPSAYFAADYCSYPVASMEATELKVPVTLLPGILMD